MNRNLLIVDDEPAVRLGYSKFLSRRGYSVYESGTLSEAKDLIGSRKYDAVLLDLKLPDGNGIDLIQELRDTFQNIAVIVITATNDISSAVEAMRRGADNYLVKPVNMEELDLFLRKSIEVESLRRNYMVQKRLEKKSAPYFGERPAMVHVQELASLAAENDAPVLIQGETGTGKSILAQWIHEQSTYSSGSFVEVNCSTLKGDMLTRELFGHVRGAFTSAIQDSPGLIEIADGGTLFLDEISTMDPSTQAEFLQVIEKKQYRRIGDVRNRYSNFRLICATNRDILKEVHAGRFRNDLYYRINVMNIVVPPLRERKGDVPSLAGHIMQNIVSSPARLSPELTEMLKDYAWPGNIRELKNMLERALILSRNGPLQVEHFPGLQTPVPKTGPSEGLPDLRKIEDRHILETLDLCHGDKNKAAERLGISRATLYRKLRRARQGL
jgi:DNA-binding NtrC family response regulator